MLYWVGRGWGNMPDWSLGSTMLDKVILIYTLKTMKKHNFIHAEN